MRDIITIIVRPAIRGEYSAFTAYVTDIKEIGSGRTVLAAVEDLFTSSKIGKVCGALESAVNQTAKS